MSDDPKRFLRQFPPAHQGAVGHCFYEVARAARQDWGERATTNVGKVCSVLFQHLQAQIAAAGDRGQVKKQDILAAIVADPESVRAFMAWVLAEIEKPSEERQARKKVSEEQGKREWMAGQAPTEKQRALLERLGYRGEIRNRQHASELIEERKDW